jgi:hypothetical protein
MLLRGVFRKLTWHILKALCGKESFYVPDPKNWEGVQVHFDLP